MIKNYRFLMLIRLLIFGYTVLKRFIRSYILKKHLLHKQGIQELKATKVKEKNSLEAKLLAI